MWSDDTIRGFGECRDKPFEEHRGRAGADDLSNQEARYVEWTDPCECVSGRPSKSHCRICE
jgi:hypothetical protein